MVYQYRWRRRGCRGVVRGVIVGLVVVGVQLVEAAAALADASGSASPTASSTVASGWPHATMDPSAMTGIWSGINTLLLGLENAVFSVWPSTPAFFKVSTLLAGLQTEFPMAPWYLVFNILPYVAVVFMVLAVRGWFVPLVQLMMKVLELTRMTSIIEFFAALFV